jgi:hypothetical protein
MCAAANRAIAGYAFFVLAILWVSAATATEDVRFAPIPEVPDMNYCFSMQSEDRRIYDELYSQIHEWCQRGKESCEAIGARLGQLSEQIRLRYSECTGRAHAAEAAQEAERRRFAAQTAVSASRGYFAPLVERTSSALKAQVIRGIQRLLPEPMNHVLGHLDTAYDFGKLTHDASSIYHNSQGRTLEPGTAWDAVGLGQDIIGHAQPLYSAMISGMSIAIIRAVNERGLSQFDVAMRNFDAAMASRAITHQIAQSLSTARSEYLARDPLWSSGSDLGGGGSMPDLNEVGAAYVAMNQQVAATIAEAQRLQQAQAEVQRVGRARAEAQAQRLQQAQAEVQQAERARAEAARIARAEAVRAESRSSPPSWKGGSEMEARQSGHYLHACVGGPDGIYHQYEPCPGNRW